MKSRILTTSVILGLLSAEAGIARADFNQPDRSNGYMPWHGQGFGAIYPVGANTGPQQSQQAQVYDISPAVGAASFADAEFQTRWSDLQVMIDRARRTFQISTEFTAAQKEFTDAQKEYGDATETVLSRLHTDADYKKIIQQRTEQQNMLKETGLGTGIRTVVATEKMETGALATQMEAVALSDSAAVQDAKTRLVSAKQALSLKQEQFELALYDQPEIVAARQQMEVARSNKAGAEGYLLGAETTRCDQLNLNSQSYSGNNVYLTGWNPYWRGGFGIGAY